MTRISIAAAAIAASLGLATSVYAIGKEMQGISLHGRQLAGLRTDGVSAGARAANLHAAPAASEPFAAEAVILPTGETVDLR